jgi:hypothetical protein
VEYTHNQNQKVMEGFGGAERFRKGCYLIVSSTALVMMMGRRDQAGGGAATGTLGPVIASPAAGRLPATSGTVPLVSCAVQSREICPAVPHL